MRISSSIQFEQSVKAMQEQQSALARLQAQIGSSRKVISPSDDPVAASREVSLDSARSFIDQMLRNQGDAYDQNARNETFIKQSINQLQGFDTRLVQAGNGIYNEADRASILQDLNSLRDQVFSIANQRDANGLYLFSGYKGDTQPFVQEGNRVVYRGDNGIREVQVAAKQNIAVNFTGQFLFGDLTPGKGVPVGITSNANTGNAALKVTTDDINVWRQGSSTTTPPTLGVSVAPYTIQFVDSAGAYTITDSQGTASTGTLDPANPVISLAGMTLEFGAIPTANDSYELASSSSTFDILDRAIDVLSRPDYSGEQTDRADELSFIRSLLRESTDRLIDGQTLTGTRANQLNSLTQRDEVNKENNIAETTRLTGMTVQDMTAAVSELTQRQIALDASQRTFGTVSRNTLFNYL